MRRRLYSFVIKVSQVCIVALSLGLLIDAPQEAYAQGRSWFYMPTGNGHGFQIFDRREGKLTYFLEHPYRFVAPSGTNIPVDRTTPGIGRRDLAHDIYFGVEVNGQGRWLNQITDQVAYLNQTNIIKV